MAGELDESDLPSLRKLATMAIKRAEDYNTTAWKFMNSEAYRRNSLMQGPVGRTGRDVRNRTFIDGAREASDWVAGLVAQIERKNTKTSGKR